MDQNMNDLMNAAKLKLEAQQKQAAAGEDIYAEMRDEMYEETGTAKIARASQDETDYSSIDYNIQHGPVDENYDDYNDYYIDPNDTAVFDGGPGFSQVDLWKKQYTKEKIFHTQILDKHFIFRSLNRFEYKQVVAIENIDALHREEIICATCVLWPYNYNFKKMASEDSGYPSTLAQIIMENSGFTKEYVIEVL